MGILAGLVAALAWTLASSLWRGLSTSLSAIQLNGLKNLIACTALLPVLVDGLPPYVPQLTVEKIDAGHFVPWEKPEAVVAAMRRWDI